MENQVMSSASSSVAQPERCNDINVVVEESKEKATEKTDPQEVVSAARRSENPSLGSGAIPTGNGFMQRYTSESNKIFSCRVCNKRFSSAKAVGGHMNAHKKERQWEEKRKEMEQEFQYQMMLTRYYQDALSYDNHSFEPLKRICTGLYPSFNNGLGDMNMTVVPPMAPTRFFTGNAFTNGVSLGRLEPIPSYNNYPSMLPRNVPPFPPHRTTNLPSYLYPQENVLNEEDVILGNDSIVETDDHDDAADQPEVTSKSWGDDLSLSL